MSITTKKALPESPPLTPPRTLLDRGRPTAIHISALSEYPPPLTPDQSPHPGFAYDSPVLVSPGDLSGAESGTIGLGFSFNGDSVYDYPLSAPAVQNDKEKEKRAAYNFRTTRASPVSQFSSPKLSLSKPRTEIASPTLSTAVSNIFRIPRRFRPALLAAMSLFVMAIILISRSVSASASAQRMNLNLLNAAREHNFSPFGRRASTEPAQVAMVPRPRLRLPPKPVGKAIKFESHEDELLALIGFITAATGNSLPMSLDTSAPIDPFVLLGFDPTGPSAADDVEYLKEEVNAQHPLVLFGKLRDPVHRELVSLLEEYRIQPPPLIVDVDERRDSTVFIPTIHRLLQTDSLPHLLMQGKLVAPAADLLNMDAKTFKAALENDAVTVRPLTKKEKGRKEKLRAQRERLLRPAPIVE